ncbi:hypothetical protein ACFV19_24720 [Streptomyces griseoluteus]|uniref:hypothetical protein n=1 Tax=Streptomyces griseoluteus TaxID=29306 RepID=UPI0036ACF0D8
MSTDFQIAPVETPAIPTPVPAPHPPPQAAPRAATVTGSKAIDHTPGGLPAIPLAVIAGNSTVAGLSAVALTAGPAAAVATAGSVLLSAVAVKAAGRRSTRRTPRRIPQPVRKPTARTNTNSNGGTGVRRTPASETRTGSGGGGARRSTGTLTNRPSAAGRGTCTAAGRGGVSLRKPSPANRNTPSPAKTPTTPKTSSGKTSPPNPGSRTAQIKNLRNDKQAAAPTRKERRTQDLAARRGLRDARRQDKRAARTLKNRNTTPTSPKTLTPRTLNPTTLKKHTPASGQTVPKTSGKATNTLRPTITDRARTKLRNTRDQATQTRADRIRQARHNAKSATNHAKARIAAHTRYGLAAAIRGLLAVPLGLLGCLTTPLGKKLGWTWLQYPGRRLYRRLTTKARHTVAARLADAHNVYTRDTNPKAPDNTDPAGAAPIADSVARAPRTGHTPDLGDTTDMSEDLKLHFLDTSEETVSAARAYEPGGMLHVRQVIKAVPVALENWAQAFAVLAEKSDAEFPLGDEIGEGLDDIHQQMRQLISHAEELAQTFDRIHEADIERLTTPRKSREAEKTWDTSANEDYDVD